MLEKDVQDAINAVEQAGELEFTYCGKKYTRTTFKETFKIREEVLDKVIEVFESKGQITWGDLEIGNKAINKAVKEAEAIETGEFIQGEEEGEARHRFAEKRAEKLTYSSVDFSFGSLVKTREFQINVTELRLKSDVRVEEDNSYVLTVYELTEKDLSRLSMIYKGNRFVEGTCNTINKFSSDATKIVDYSAKNIVAPVAKVGFRAGFKVGKTLVSSIAKIGGIAVAETIYGVRETADEIKNDVNINVAKAEVIKAKNDIIGSKKGFGSSKGININQ